MGWDQHINWELRVCSHWDWSIEGLMPRGASHHLSLGAGWVISFPGCRVWILSTLGRISSDSEIPPSLPGSGIGLDFPSKGMAAEDLILLGEPHPLARNRGLSSCGRSHLVPFLELGSGRGAFSLQGGFFPAELPGTDDSVFASGRGERRGLTSSALGG